MSARRAGLTLLLAGCIVLAGCDKPQMKAAMPPPMELSGEVAFEATGYYCGMQLTDHEGPKGQIYLTRRSDPLWFSSVRDTIAFTRLAEEPRDITAIYVNDMGRAHNWDQPEAGTWIDATTAWYVIESRRRGGMGAQEAIPFSDQAAAQDFVALHGGKLVRMKDIPDIYVLGPVDLAPITLDAGSDAGREEK